MATAESVYTQADRPIKVSTPLGKDAVLLERFAGAEALSELFRFDLDLLAPRDKPVAFEKLLGQPVTIDLSLPGEESRYFNGIVSRLVQGPVVPNPRGSVDFIRYRAEVVPKLWLLTLQVRSRTFQHLSVPDILKKVLTGITLDDKIQGTFEPRDYCVQYRESDFHFASRLMEEEGIYYYFTHSDGAHKMVLADTPQGHADVPGATDVKYQSRFDDPDPDEDHVVSWEKAQEIRSGKYTLWDHSFELPDKNLEATQPVLTSVAAGKAAHQLKVGGNDALEIYDFPGAYANRFDGVDKGGSDQASDLQKIFQDNKRTVGIRMQAETAPGLTITGSGRCRQFAAGCKFTLSDHETDADGSYVLTRVDHDARLEGAYITGQTPRFLYGNRFACLPAALPYRPARTTRKPVVEGHQTAVVVGPQGQEIFTDKYGRVKVQFFWDREGQKDADSSCWVRVGSIWAGQQWGGVHIPRIGQEVLIAFLEGDPDQPIVVGSVYNANNMPPYTLPDNMTQSGLKSRSTLKGEAENFNELRFEDKKGEEQVYFHAEKNFDRVVENNDTLKVGFEKKDQGDQTVEIFNNQATTIGKGEGDAADGSQTYKVFNAQTINVGYGEGNCKDGSQTVTVYKDRTTTIKTGDETLTVSQGNRTVNVDQGNDTHNVKQGNREVNIDTGNDTLNVKTGNRTINVNTGNDTLNVKTGNRAVNVDTGNDTLTLKLGNQTTTLNAGKSTIEAMQGIELKVGGSSLKISPAGITLQATMIKIEGTAFMNLKSAIVQTNASGMLILKGGITMIN